MDANVLYAVLILLALSVALNLKLTFCLLSSVRNMMAAQGQDFTLPVGEPVPAVRGKPMLGGKKTVFTAGPRPAALLFLSSGCPKCKSKLPEIGRMLARADEAGLDIWLVSREAKWRLRRFLLGTALPGVTMRVSTDEFKLLNPTMTSPYYMFLNESGRLEAGGMIGDENWLSFREQMEDAEVATEADAEVAA